MEGLEKIAADLRVERTKATNALRDRARLKVDNESLHQELKEKTDYVSVLEESMADLKEQLASSKHNLEKFQVDYEGKSDLVATQKAQILEMTEARGKSANEKEDVLSNLQKLESNAFTMREENELLKGKLLSAEKMQRRMEAEASEVVILKNTLEEEHTVNLEKMREKSRLIESMKDRVAAAEALELSYKQVVAANEGLKAELDSSIKAESKLSDSARKYAREYTEKTIAREMLTEELARLKQEQGESRGMYKALEQANVELKGRIQAEVEGHGFTKTRAENLQKSIDTLRSELGMATRSTDDLRSRNSELENSLSKYKVELKEAKESISSLRVSNEAVAKLRVNLADAHKAAMENEDAKAQLFTLKKQMTKANLEAGRSSFNNQQSGMNLSFSESGPGAPSGAGLISAEKYEEMIKQLNAELGASDGKLQSTLKELSDAQQRIVELGSVEEELVLTKAAAEDLSIEKHAQATSAAEAAERSLRMLASKEGAVREVMALERELEQSKRELEYCRNEVSKEKIRHKTLYAEKLGAERLAAEKTALCSKIEGELESAKNNIIEKEYEMEHQKRRERELESTVESMKLTLWQVENRPHGEAGSMSPLSSMLPVPPSASGQGDSSALVLQLEQAEHQLSLCHREIDSLKESVSVQRKGFDNALEECNRLYEANRRLKRDAYGDEGDTESVMSSTWKRGSAAASVDGSPPAKGTSAGLQSVRKELSETMNNMQEASTAALHKEQLVHQLQAELQQEKGSLLAMQDRFTTLADQETEMVTGQPAPEYLGGEEVAEGNMGAYADQLINSGKLELPGSPIGMMPFSSPTLQASKSRMASVYLEQHPDEKGNSSQRNTPTGVVVAGLSPARRSTMNPGLAQSLDSQDEGRMTSQQMSTESKDGEEEPVKSQKEKRKAFESDVKMIKGRKGTTVMADRAVTHRRRLEVNHQKERELRKQAMQAVRQINRRQLQTGAVAQGQSASSSPMPALKQILPQKTDIHQAHQLLKGKAGHKERIKSSLRRK